MNKKQFNHTVKRNEEYTQEIISSANDIIQGNSNVIYNTFKKTERLSSHNYIIITELQNNNNNLGMLINRIRTIWDFINITDNEYKAFSIKWGYLESELDRAFETVNNLRTKSTDLINQLT